MGTGCQQVAVSAARRPHALPAPQGAPAAPEELQLCIPSRLQPRCRCRHDTPCIGGQIWHFKVLL